MKNRPYTMNVGTENYTDLIRARIANLVANSLQTTTALHTHSVQQGVSEVHPFPETTTQANNTILPHSFEANQRLQSILLEKSSPAVNQQQQQNYAAAASASAISFLTSTESNVICWILVGVLIVIIGYCAYQLLKARRRAREQENWHLLFPGQRGDNDYDEEVRSECTPRERYGGGSRPSQRRGKDRSFRY